MQKTEHQTIWSYPPDVLALQPQQVDLWRIRLDLPIVSVILFESSLSMDEAQRASRFRFPADRQRYTAAHGCLRDILSKYLHCEPGDLNFSTNQYGKPFILGHHLEFNLSHSGDFALVGVARNRCVGVDVERIRPDLECERIASRFFSQNEVSELLSSPPGERQTVFFNGWARKEAFIKAQGQGLALPLESFDVSLSEPAVLRASRLDPDETFRWTLLSLEVDPTYAAAVAVKGQSLEFRLWDWDTQARVSHTPIY